MKRGIYVDRMVSDPRKENPDFGKVGASQEGYLLDRYLRNMEIVEELRKQYGVMMCNNIMTAADIIAGGREMFDFMITHLPPRDDEKTGYARRGLQRKLEGIGTMQRAVRIRDWMQEQREFIGSTYDTSLFALRKARAKSPNTVIIAYTGAPGMIRKRCLDEKLVDHMIHRERYGQKIELEWIKDILAGGKGMYDPHEAAAEHIREMLRGGENGA